jgi:hypothetical protein
VLVAACAASADATANMSAMLAEMEAHKARPSASAGVKDSRATHHQNNKKGEIMFCKKWRCNACDARQGSRSWHLCLQIGKRGKIEKIIFRKGKRRYTACDARQGRREIRDKNI